jgi:hypothetical protein
MSVLVWCSDVVGERAFGGLGQRRSWSPTSPKEGDMGHPELACLPGQGYSDGFPAFARREIKIHLRAVAGMLARDHRYSEIVIPLLCISPGVLRRVNLQTWIHNDSRQLIRSSGTSSPLEYESGMVRFPSLMQNPGVFRARAWLGCFGRFVQLHCRNRHTQHGYSRVQILSRTVRTKAPRGD